MNALGPAGFLLIALAGAFGALLRYLLDVALSAAQHLRAAPATRIFPLGILLANTLACLLVGAGAAWAAGHGISWHPSDLDSWPGLLLLSLVLGVGGGLSTMSTFIVAAVSLWRSGARAMAASYTGLTLGAGLAAGLLGGLLASLLP